jgi:hypothetical protein
MDRDEQPIELGTGDLIEVGGPSGSRAIGSRPARWLTAALAIVVVAYIAYTNRSQPPPDPHPAPPAVAIPRPPTNAPIPNSSPTVTEGRSGLLGVTAGWDLFAWSNIGIVRIEMATGRITVTPVPDLNSGARSVFLVGRDWAMIRSQDGVPGYLIPDGRAAQEITRASADSLAWPGPDPEHVWTVVSDGTTETVQLVDEQGRPTSTRIAVPPDMQSSEASDGAGYIVLAGLGGIYDARPSGLTRVTTGGLLAIGPSTWLAVECDDHHRCTTIVIDRATGARHTLPAPAGLTYGSLGSIAPDGRTAAIFVPDTNGESVIHLVDLTTGADRSTGITLVNTYDSSGVVWSPDSTWLFVADRVGPVRAVDAATMRVQQLDLPLTAISQLAIRD